jgi:hypothetical protein
MLSPATVLETIARSKQMIAETKTAVQLSRVAVDQCRRDRERMDKKRVAMNLAAQRAAIMKVLRAPVQDRRLRWPVGELERIATQSAPGRRP